MAVGNSNSNSVSSKELGMALDKLKEDYKSFKDFSPANKTPARVDTGLSRSNLGSKNNTPGLRGVQSSFTPRNSSPK